MDNSRKNQVSLRGASAREISRDALLEKVSLERELRNHARKAAAASILIQRIWRRYSVTKKVAIKLQKDWKDELSQCDGLMCADLILSRVLRPFLFFVEFLSVRCRTICVDDMECMESCFKILLESNATDPTKNFCSLALVATEERRIWTYQARKLIVLCSFILSESVKISPGGQDILVLTSLAMRFLVVLTDLKSWKCITDSGIGDAEIAVKDLIKFIGSSKSGFYTSIGRYIRKLEAPSSWSRDILAQADNKFLITASAVTVALRPFHTTKMDFDKMDVHSAAMQCSLFILTIPWLHQRLPPVLVQALKHKSVLSPCFQAILILRDDILMEMNRSKVQDSSSAIPPFGWALANIICLATANENDFVDLGGLNRDIDYSVYIQVVNILAENLLSWLENSSYSEEMFGQDPQVLHEREDKQPLKKSYVDLLRPVCQQWHLKTLLAISGANATKASSERNCKHRCFRKLELVDVAYFYSYMLRIFSILNSTVGSMHALNMLSFSPGFIVTLWEALEISLFPGNGHNLKHADFPSTKVSKSKRDGNFESKKQRNKDGGKWVSVLQKITGKSHTEVDSVTLVDGESSAAADEDFTDVWDVECLRGGPKKVLKDMACMLHLFCATYSHLLLVLDDIEFYEKQVPFTLEQQRRIASALNTMVYNGLAHGIDQLNKPLMDSAIRCMHLMYERDCRHQFCPSVLWLSPAKKTRLPIASAARTHEIISSSVKSEESLAASSMYSVMTVTPHVYPFEERVQMFREFISMDKAGRKMAGEVTEPGSRAIEIVIRRGHIVEDGFKQLNSLGPRLKSSIHVSFVSECGLPEAGLDYGGLSKEFLTDISKTVFSPEYGLFSQTMSSDRLLIPNPAAKYLENGIQMIEFLGRVVGKALYEGILLDYSFSHVFVQKLLGRYSFLDELSTLDPELYRNLMYVKHYDGDVQDLCLDFTTTEESFGMHKVIELKPGGKDISVTNENKMQYVHAIADYKLNRQILPFSNAFYRGLTDLITASWLKLFNASEFNQLLSGGDIDIDVDDLKKNTKYTGGYSEGRRTVKLFWEVMKGFQPKERCMLLKFVTSCSRPPLLGFKHLQPSFTIHKVSCDSSLWETIGGQDVERLPSASTCYNTLKLPTYKRLSTLREKLLYAISSNTGFELS